MFNRIVKWLNYYRPDEALSMDEWVEVDRKFKNNAPIRYFLMKAGPHISLKYLLERRTRDFLYGIRYFFTRPNNIRTGLKNTYHDKPELLFHGCFNLLVDYVEQECANAHIIFDMEQYKSKRPMRVRFIPRFFRPRYRNVEDGIAHLRWASELGEESPTQAEDAKEYIELYTWYTKIRPNRVEPEYPIEYDDSEHFFTTFTDKWKDENPEDAAKLDAYYKEHRRLEEEWKKEDDAMLLRLIKVKDGLWQ